MLTGESREGDRAPDIEIDGGSRGMLSRIWLKDIDLDSLIIGRYSVDR